MTGSGVVFAKDGMVNDCCCHLCLSFVFVTLFLVVQSKAQSTSSTKSNHESTVAYDIETSHLDHVHSSYSSTFQHF